MKYLFQRDILNLLIIMFFGFFVFIFFTNYKCNLEGGKVNDVRHVPHINIFIYYIKWMWINEK